MVLLQITAKVSELIISELLWLNYSNPESPLNIYVHSIGTQTQFHQVRQHLQLAYAPHVQQRSAEYRDGCKTTPSLCALIGIAAPSNPLLADTKLVCQTMQGHALAIVSRLGMPFSNCC